jgi:hypothetical protein
MKWLEIIKLRSMGKDSALLDELWMSLSKAPQKGGVEIKTYRHAALDTDLSVHLYWRSNQPEENGSSLGLRLAQALKEFGLVDHSVWIAENSGPEDFNAFSGQRC